MRSSHLPTWLLILGYPIFWLELYFFDTSHGHTTWLAWTLFSLVALVVVFSNFLSIKNSFKKFCNEFKEYSFFLKFFIVFVLIFVIIILFASFIASLLPPHLPQEYDVLNYHITIPRQHLILSSISHIPWSVADLYLMPLDYSLSPYWLATEMPNKFPQFLFALGLLGVAASLMSKIRKDLSWERMLILLAILGAHGLAIQFGTAMLDIVMVYLFIAAIDSFLDRRFFMGTVELTFYFWSKSFIPLQSVVLIVALSFFCFLANLFRFKVFIFDRVAFSFISFKKIYFVGIRFIILSFFIAVPFLVKNIYYTGTPLFPFAVGAIGENYYQKEDPDLWEIINDRAESVLAVKNQYGEGRSLKNFIEHFWFLAVPEKGVNNRFDYPLGLVYLLIVGPFLYFFCRDLLRKKLDLVSLFIVLFWLSFWFGSQQSRFLFVPLVLMMMIVLKEPIVFRKIFCLGIVLSVMFTSISVFRAHKRDLFKSSMQVIREKDRKLIEMSNHVERSVPVVINFEDAAFANFAVNIKHKGSVFILNPGSNE